MISRATVAGVGLSLLVVLPAPLAAQDSLASARQLYASAEYSGALTMLNNLLKANPPVQDRQLIDLYRTFCLVALGGMEEAKTAVDAMITRDPLYRPNTDDVPPRLQTLFRDARKRLLPTIIQQRYLTAKAAFDRDDHKAAAEGFTQVLQALLDPDLGLAASQPPLADLKVLASGFNDLSVRALTPAPAPASIPPTPPTPTPTTASSSTAPLPSPSGSSAAAAAANAAARRPPEIYTADVRDVVEPVAIRQEMPPYPGRVTNEMTGIVEVVIDETGKVESASMLQSVDPRYNRLVLVAAKNWVYRPARRDGAPVKYKKRIQIAVAPGS
jgi:TonB family protein